MEQPRAPECFCQDQAVSLAIIYCFENRAHLPLSFSTDFELVIKFINMLMSDTTFHLDESLTGLAKINSIRSEMEDRTTWEAKPEAERKELESQLSSAEANTPFHTMMGRSHVKLMKEFTATTKEPFLTGEIVGRLAAVSRQAEGRGDLKRGLLTYIYT